MVNDIWERVRREEREGERGRERGKEREGKKEGVREWERERERGREQGRHVGVFQIFAQSICDVMLLFSSIVVHSDGSNCDLMEAEKRELQLNKYVQDLVKLPHQVSMRKKNIGKYQLKSYRPTEKNVILINILRVIVQNIHKKWKRVSWRWKFWV